MIKCDIEIGAKSPMYKSAYNRFVKNPHNTIQKQVQQPITAATPVFYHLAAAKIIC